MNSKSNNIPKSQTSTGNVFEDLGFTNSDEMLAKSKIALQIQKIIQNRKLDQQTAGEIMGIDQSKVSKILLGKLSGFSLERLIRFVNELDHDVDIHIKPKPPRRKKAAFQVHITKR